MFELLNKWNKKKEENPNEKRTFLLIIRCPYLPHSRIQNEILTGFILKGHALFSETTL